MKVSAINHRGSNLDDDQYLGKETQTNKQKKNPDSFHVNQSIQICLFRD